MVRVSATGIEPSIVSWRRRPHFDPVKSARCKVFSNARFAARFVRPVDIAELADSASLWRHSVAWLIGIAVFEGQHLKGIECGHFFDAAQAGPAPVVVNHG